MNTSLFNKPHKLTPSLVLLLSGLVALLPAPMRAAEPWTELTGSLLKRIEAEGLKPDWPGGCSGVVVNRLTGDVTVKVVGHGFWRSADKGKTWTRLDQGTISGRDETGWATNLDQNNPVRMASFSLDGTAGWTVDGRSWNKFTSLGRNWDYGSVDWGTEVPKIIIAAKHETSPRGEVYVTDDGGVSWTQLSIHVLGEPGVVSMVGAMGGRTLVYSRGEGIQRSVDLGRTWTAVSAANPQTRIPVFFQGAHYLGTAAGLLVSRDQGATWQQQGGAVNIWQGPFFGRDGKTMVVAGKGGVHLTEDAGATWNRVADLKPKEGGFVFTTDWFGCYAWDPVNRVVYASSMGNPVYKLALPDK